MLRSRFPSADRPDRRRRARSAELVLEAKDGNRFRAFRARAAETSGAGIVILPDVRGLHPYYEELALRFAENGVDALAIDYFGRTAGTDPARRRLRVHAARRAGHAGPAWPRTSGPPSTISGARRAAASERALLDRLLLRGPARLPDGDARARPGRLDRLLRHPGRAGPQRTRPAPADLAGEMRNPILGLFGGADRAITAGEDRGLRAALTAARVPHRLVAYDGAPHSFFDRKADEFAEASAQAWEETLTFIRGHTPSVIGA